MGRINMSEDNGNPYVSSVISKYGDIDKVSIDSQRLYDIINRQGIPLLLDCIAEHNGRLANKWKLIAKERQRLIEKYPNELREALSERL